MHLRLAASLASALAALLAAPAVTAQDAARPKFASAPSADDMAAVFPAKAVAESRQGRAAIECAVLPDGALAACEVKSETPADYGFGAAALSLAGKIRLAPGADLDRIIIPLRFDPPPPQREPVYKTGTNDFDYLGGVGPYYPDRAARMGVGGFVVIECHLADTGALSECRLIQEMPDDVGFVDAVKAMLKRGALRAQPRVIDGVVVKDELVRVRVPFQIRHR